jgi:iron(III) transport system substrate-binding protein
MINVSGVGVFASSKKQAAAEDLINFLTSADVQENFVSDTHEYSLIPGATAPTDVPTLNQIGAPTIDLNTLKNIKQAQDLLIEVGLL